MSDKEIDEKKQSYNMKIVAINLAVLAVYTIVSKMDRDLGPIFDAFLLVVHFITCIVWGGITGRKVWILTAFVIVLIGFSTCVGLLWN